MCANFFSLNFQADSNSGHRIQENSRETNYIRHSKYHGRGDFRFLLRFPDDTE